MNVFRLARLIRLNGHERLFRGVAAHGGPLAPGAAIGAGGRRFQRGLLTGPVGEHHLHFRRHFGGPGHLSVAPGALVLTDRRERRRVVHAGAVVRVERKRWEPPTGNHWIEVSDETLTGFATMTRRRAGEVAASLEGCGFEVVW